MEVKKDALKHPLTCIEYPGIVRNVGRMLETLGGIEEISKVICQKNRRLELRFRPGDVTCKPTCGDRIKTNGVLLKIKVRVPKRDNDDDDNDDKEHQVTGCEIVGKIQTLFKFKSLCDFQFLPMLQDDKGVMRDVTRSLLPLKIDGDNFKNWIDEPAEYFLPPAVFCRIDSQSLNTYMYRKDNKDTHDDSEESLIGRTRKRRSGHAIFISFDVGLIPSKPREKAIKFLKVKFLSGEQYETIKKCFEERPVWSKLALMSVTGYMHDQMKYLLPSVAYYFVTGPYRVMWVRLGYDPRIEPSSRIYQTLDYRIRAPAGLINKIKAKRNYSNCLLPNKMSHQPGKSVVLSKVGAEEAEKAEEDSARPSQNLHEFRPGMFPPSRQLFYQYCDIKVPEIETMLDRLPKVSSEMTCDPKHGWLPPGFDIQCREILNKHVLDFLTSSAADEAIKMDDYADDSSDGEHLAWEEDFEDEEIDEPETK
ncbi:RNA polymerase III transcription factor (TF)IIIC subunit [Nesidiocoris tenuis]|uniref:RNA polymerase III transcription factor (TF)IIIC subunit n=1 Tax=Nesidiocoris tenuis TaxID=355587 RepID=A0ABN7AG48_9HEMI|nr:RNA polymerase III transcription factor (TF)IIIC subunit [Nesidiocoris tenuis]